MGQPNENTEPAVDDTVTDTAPLSAEDYEVPATDEPAEPAL